MITKFIFSFSLILLGLFFLTIYFKNRRKGANSFNWPSIEGEITVSRGEDGSDENGGWYLIPRINYEYEVGGTSYKSHIIQFGFLSELVLAQKDITGYERGTKILKKYPINSKVRIYYDPNNPRISTLEQGVCGENRWIMATGIAIVLLGLYMLTPAWTP